MISYRMWLTSNRSNTCDNPSQKSLVSTCVEGCETTAGPLGRKQKHAHFSGSNPTRFQSSSSKKWLPPSRANAFQITQYIPVFDSGKRHTPWLGAPSVTARFRVFRPLSPDPCTAAAVHSEKLQKNEPFLTTLCIDSFISFHTHISFSWNEVLYCFPFWLWDPITLSATGLRNRKREPSWRCPPRSGPIYISYRSDLRHSRKHKHG